MAAAAAACRSVAGWVGWMWFCLTAAAAACRSPPGSEGCDFAGLVAATVGLRLGVI